MLVALSTCHTDLAQARDLLEWIYELDGKTRHRVLLVTGEKVGDDDGQALIDLASRAFESVHKIRLRSDDVRGWPQAPNQMFCAAVEWVSRYQAGHFLWLEPDMAPMKPGWLDEINTEYIKQRKPFMGTLYPNPKPHLNGGMVYPQNVRRFNPFCLAASKLPWDLTRPEVTLKHGHNSHLIQRDLADAPNNVAHTFHNLQSLSRIRDGAVLFHGCRDKTLIARLREKRNQTVTKMEPGPVLAVKRKVKALLPWTRTYYHSGNLGDIVYALYAIKANGGGDLLIGPRQNHTSPCSKPITKPQFEAFAPLLRSQPYLRHVEFVPEYPFQRLTCDLNLFRNYWNNWELRQLHSLDTLCKAHFYSLGILHKFHQNEPWLTVPTLQPERPGNRIVVHRSSRYHAESMLFPWRRIIAQFGRRMVFVGLRDEWREFTAEVGVSLPFMKVKDLLEMAQLIKGASGFVGNQSLPLSLAIGMGKRVYCEEWENSTDCRFDNATYRGHLLHPITEIEKWV